MLSKIFSQTGRFCLEISCNMVHASPIQFIMCHHGQNLYVSTALLNRKKCAKFLLRCVSFSNVKIILNKPYSEPLTFAWQRFLLQREYFDCLRFLWVFLLCLLKFSLFFIANFGDQVKHFISTVN